MIPEWLYQTFLVLLVIFVVAYFQERRKSNGPSSKTFRKIPDKYKTIEEVVKGLRDAGMESCNLILGIDYTKSNETSGEKTFGGLPLHHIHHSAPKNPYMRVIELIGRTLESFDEDHFIPVFGFGDLRTKDRSVFPFYEDKNCYTFNEVLDRYIEITPVITLSGPTNFGPVIRKAISVVKENNNDFHILVIIADGQVNKEADTISAIVEASHYPLSIIMVGVGDGPWDMMHKFDDKLPQRRFDNFQFVNYHEATDPSRTKFPDASFATAALMEVPEQYNAMKALGYFS